MRSYSLLKRNEEEFEEPERAHGSVRSYSLLKRNGEEFEEPERAHGSVRSTDICPKEVRSMYTFESRVRYSETDESGRLSVTGIMNYFQDCSTFQSEDLHMGLSHLERVRRAWWLNSWQIVVSRYPALGERIRISTYPYGFRGIYGYRNFLLQDEAGECIVRADSRWVFYDLEHECPARVTQEEIRGYGELGSPLSMPETQGRLCLPENCGEKEPVTVSRHHLDTNFHVNNARYVEIAREFLPENFEIEELLAEYRKAAVLGDVMIPRICRTEDGYMVSLTEQSGRPFVNMKLKGRLK